MQLRSAAILAASLLAGKMPALPPSRF